MNLTPLIIALSMMNRERNHARVFGRMGAGNERLSWLYACKLWAWRSVIKKEFPLN